MAQYEWYTDPAGNKHFARVFGKKATPKKVAAVVRNDEPVAAPVEDTTPDDNLRAGVVVEAVAPKRVTAKRAPAKKKSNG